MGRRRGISCLPPPRFLAPLPHAPLLHPPLPHPPQLPPTMPCLDFALTWHTNPHKSPVVSFWRPLAPAGEEGPAVDWAA